MIDRERDTLREVARLVAERAAAEAEVERVDSTANADEPTAITRTSGRRSIDRAEGLTSTADPHEDEAKRRGITDASIASDAAAKDEFARASRKIASEFDAVREQARGDHAKAKAKAVAEFDAGERAAAVQYAAARKPIDDA